MIEVQTFEPFGETHIPPLSSGNLSASYHGRDWRTLSKSWNITMYEELPGDKKSVEQSGRTASASKDGDPIEM